MPYLNVGKENFSDIELYYEDHGTGRPVVLIHGWPLSGRSWEKQLSVLLGAGYRVITYDRRGFGRSSQPSAGYDYDTLTRDLNTLLETLELRDVTLVGFSMGGGEVARYLGTYQTNVVRQAVFISAIPPFLLKTPKNPEGVEGKVFDEIQQALMADRPAFLKKFFENFYNADQYRGSRISDEALQFSWNEATQASPIGTHDCVKAWGTDFRKDLDKIHVPTMVIHGTADRIVPLEASGKRISEQMKGSVLVVIEDAPHGLIWTHADEVNQALLSFLKQPQPVLAYS